MTGSAPEWGRSGPSTWAHIPADVPGEAQKDIMGFIKGLESTCVSYGPLLNQTELLITTRQGFR